jgi:hypothetical protein
MDPSLDNHTMRLFYYDLFYAFPAHPLPSYVQVDSSQILARARVSARTIRLKGVFPHSVRSTSQFNNDA